MLGAVRLVERVIVDFEDEGRAVDVELAEIMLAVGIVAAIPVGILASSQCDADLLRLIILGSTIGPVSGKVTLARSELPSFDVLLFREWERLFPSSSPTRPIRTSPLPGRRSWMFPPCEPSRAFPRIPAYDGRYYRLRRS